MMIAPLIQKFYIYFLPLLLSIVFYFLIPSQQTWLTLTFAGFAMGLILYIMSSGLTMVFGLMDVLNFGQGIFISLGAYIAVSVTSLWVGLSVSNNLLANLLLIVSCILLAMLISSLVGFFFEKYLIRPVYGQHLKQILVTVGGLIIGEELFKIIWGPLQLPLELPSELRGLIYVYDIPMEKYRILAILVGGFILLGQFFLLSKTKIGLLIRAGVENREMVESLGYNIRQLFMLVFSLACALAGLGGVLWGFYQQNVTPQMGSHLNILIFIIIIIGGLGSTTGTVIGALLVGLLSNYVGYLFPKIALFSNLLLLLLILLWRPRGLIPVTNR
ncbi:MAG: branched-chain amino acid ABC transporter permease [Gammaproteobacteria bacterium]|nr:branched-chain amino acid ABC transporter permease [Gammaproteobacteria bacterium]